MIELKKRTALNPALLSLAGLVEGKATTVVLNDAGGLDPALNPASWELLLLDDQNSVAFRSAAAVNTLVLPNSRVALWVDFIVTGLRPYACYRMALVDANDSLQYIGDRMLYLSQRRAVEESYVSLRFGNMQDLEGVPYSLLPSGFAQQVHLQLFTAEQENRGERTVYQSVVTGQPRTLNSFRQGALSLESGPMSRSMLWGLHSVFLHSKVWLNGQQVHLAEGFSFEQVGSSALERAKFWVLEDSLSARVSQPGCA